MLVIKDAKQFSRSVRLAEKTGTEAQLLHWLAYLNDWHGMETTVVELCADFPADDGFIAWFAYHLRDGVQDKRAFYNGGLVFHVNTKEWSIHS